MISARTVFHCLVFYLGFLSVYKTQVITENRIILYNRNLRK